MHYRPLGKTGFNISVLGFGAMRLPHKRVGDESVIDEDLSIAMMHRAFEGGVNYVDTAYMYTGGQSEVIVGKALKGWRDRIMLSTKLPLGDVKTTEDFRRLLDEQLAKLDTDRIDFYHFHGLGAGAWEDKVNRFKLLDEMDRARGEGLIGHVSFSFHDKPEVMRTLVDSYAFSDVLCQYNFLDQANADSIAYARQKGVGVIVMGPVGGGRLASPMEYVKESLGTQVPTPEIALRFVLANPNVSCALSGMSSMEQVEQNLRTVENAGPLSATELAQLDEAMKSRAELAKLYCTGCGYCMPCPNEVNIPACFEAMITHKVYGFTNPAMQTYSSIGTPGRPGKRADACVDCGECESKCPQKIPIRDQLKQVDQELGSKLDPMPAS